MKRRTLLYALSFLEGASVMAAELLGAKMLSPYFGSSLYVWASVLGITLGGLATGYFAGGVISEKKNNERNLYAILLVSAIFLIVMPMMAKAVMLHTGGFSLLASILISSFIFLFPPVFFMGMVSPMIVKCVSEGAGEKSIPSGKVAGTVFAISTLGGILSTFLLGFYLIQNFGLTKPAIGVGIILGIIPFFKLITSRKFYSLIFLLAAFFSFNGSKRSLEKSEVKILYSSEGLLGQIIVADYPLYEEQKKRGGFQRILFVNRSTQTIVTHTNGKETFFEYVNLISQSSVVSVQLEEKQQTTNNGQRTTDKRALVLGLGGGSVANILMQNGFDVDAVELDERMADCAKKYFELNGKVNVTIDDARHFVQSHYSLLTTHYSVIVLDAFIGEVNPHHLFTTEFFSEIKSQLSDSGIFFINGNGYWNGEAGIGMRSVCKTLLASGFNVEIIPTREEEEYRNLLFIAKKSNSTQGALRTNFSTSLEDAVILVDEKPQLEILNSEANKRWREACMKYFLSGYYSGQDKLLFK